MSYQQERLAEIADAIREKDGTTEPIQGLDFAERIRAIPAGGQALDPLYWPIKQILADDVTPPGYAASMILLFSDAWSETACTGADAYRFSDGTFVETGSLSERVSHAITSADCKPDSSGGVSRYTIRYYKNEIISTVATQPQFGNAAAAGGRYVGGWPVAVVSKGCTIAAQNFFTQNYSMRSYDHIDCTYTGVNLSGLLGGTNVFCLQEIPSYFKMASAPTAFGGAFLSKSLRHIDVSWLDFSTITNMSGAFNGANLLEEIVGVMDFANVTNVSTFLNGCYVLKKLMLRNVKLGISLPSSVLTAETIDDTIRNGLADLTGKSAQVLTISNAAYCVSEEQRAIAASKNWIIA